MFGETFYEVAAILGLATLLAVIGQKLRQPLIIMFLLAGILAGPAGLGIIHSYDQIDLLAKVGIAVLLFIVGLKLDLHLIRTTGPVALATGLGQIIFTSSVGLALSLALGMTLINAAYVAVALTFSSTIIIVKLLSDKNEIDSLHGQIAIGFLIVQDIVAILALVGLTTLGSQVEGGGAPVFASVMVVVRGLGLLVGVGLLMRYVLPGLVDRLAHSQELLALFAIAWAVFLGATGDYFGFSKEVGAFLAGVSLANTGYRDRISARLTGLRDFLLLFFFIDLGARLDWSTVTAQLGNALLLALFVLVGNPIIVLIIMGGMGYRRRTSFKAGLMVAQISEFSLIVAALGLSLGHITPETMGLITLVGIATICISTYMILYSEPLYRFLSTWLKVFERKHPYRETEGNLLQEMPVVDVILIGLGNYGSGLFNFLLSRSKTVVGVDFDPAALDKWRTCGQSVLYGDMADPEVYTQLPLNRARWVVSTVQSEALNKDLLEHLKRRAYDGKVAVAATSEQESHAYSEIGVHVVLRPFRDAAEQAADSLTHAMDVLPASVDWPIAFRQVRIKPDAMFAGQSIRRIPIRETTGCSILAVIRAGRVHHDPTPEFQVYPDDRLLLVGTPDDLRQAEELLGQLQTAHDLDDNDPFSIAEVAVAKDSKAHGKTLADLAFHQAYGVTVVGIRRGNKKITAPKPQEPLFGDDHLVVIGATQAVEAIRAQAPL